MNSFYDKEKTRKFSFFHCVGF